MPAQLEKMNRLHGRCRAGKVRQRSVPWAVGRAHARSGAAAPGKRRCGEGTSPGRGQTGLWGYLGDGIRRGGGGGGRRHALVEARTHGGGYRRDACERYCDLLSIGRQCNIPPSMREAKIFQFTTATLPANPAFCQYDRMVYRCGHRRVAPARTGRTGERLLGYRSHREASRPSPPQPLHARRAALFALPGSPWRNEDGPGLSPQRRCNDNENLDHAHLPKKGQRWAGAAGRVLTHDQLLQRVWGLTNSGGSRPVRTAVKNLRRKLGDDADSPHLHLQRASRRLPDAQGRDAGTGGAVSVWVVWYTTAMNTYPFKDLAMNMPNELTVPQAASYLNVSEETVRRNIRAKRLTALRRGNSVVYTAPCPCNLRPIATIPRPARYGGCSSDSVWLVDSSIRKATSGR